MSMGLLRVFAVPLVLLAGLVSAVGSGGGGSWSFGSGHSWGPLFPPPGIAPVDITPTNARAVSATVVQAFARLSDVTVTLGGQVFPAPPAAPALLPGNSKFGLFEIVSASGESVTAPCAVSGTVTVSGRPGNAPVFPAEQDTFDLVFNACNDGDGFVLDGRFALLFSELEGDVRTDVFRLRYTLREMTLEVLAGRIRHTVSTNPGFMLGWDSLAFPVAGLTAGTGLLMLASPADVYSWRDGELYREINADISIPGILEAASKTLMQSDVLGGSLYYETITPLAFTDGQVPESGEILISEWGAEGTIRIVIESAAVVRLETDEDGDGVVDDDRLTTWPELLGEKSHR